MPGPERNGSGPASSDGKPADRRPSPAGDDVGVARVQLDLRDAAERPGICLGVDPGLNRTGYAILERTPRGPRLREAGVIRSSDRCDLPARVREIGEGLRDVLVQFAPQAMAIEQVFSTGKFPKSALLMAHARGVILFAAAERDVPVVHYAPTRVKQVLTGHGRAPKDQVQRAIRRELGLDRDPEPHDVADACAVALCHYYSLQLVELGDNRTR